MQILGIDPGLNTTGYGVLRYEQNKMTLIEAGIIQPNRKDLLEHRLQKIYKGVEDVIDQYQPDVLVLEKLYSHYRHPATVSVLGHVRGVICLLCAQKKIELIEHSPKRIRKSVTGTGNATKEQTQRMVAHLLKIDAGRLTLDASDALALAVGYTQMHRHQI